MLKGLQQKMYEEKLGRVGWKNPVLGWKLWEENAEAAPTALQGYLVGDCREDGVRLLLERHVYKTRHTSWYISNLF